jgi:CRP/FNR family cyclic AMP-dependent transcriptional regulator
VVRLPAGQVLFRAGDSADGCYRVEDGLLKVTMVSNAGTERILAFHGPGAIVGGLAIIDGLPRTTSAVAVRDSGLSFLSRAAFEAFAEKHHPEFCQSLFRLLTKRVRERDKVVAATSFLSLKGRIAQTLLELSDHFGQEVRPGRVVIPFKETRSRTPRSASSACPLPTSPSAEEEQGGRCLLRCFPEVRALTVQSARPFLLCRCARHDLLASR